MEGKGKARGGEGCIIAVGGWTPLYSKQLDKVFDHVRYGGSHRHDGGQPD